MQSDLGRPWRETISVMLKDILKGSQGIEDERFGGVGAGLRGGG